MKSFILSGKASGVFKLISLMAKAEKEKKDKKGHNGQWRYHSHYASRN